MALKWNEIVCSYIRQGQLNSIAMVTSSVLGMILSPLITCANGLVLVSILRTPSLRVPSNILICLLAMSDFLVGFLFLPLQTAWLLDEYLNNSCVFFMVMMSCGWAFAFASFLSVVALSCERFLALFKPLKYTTYLTVGRIAIVGCLIWTISVVLSVIYVLSSKRLVTGIAVAIAMPGLTLIIYIYYRIIQLVRQHHFQIRTQQVVWNAHDSATAERAHQRKLAVTLGYVIGVFFISYAPTVANLFITAINGNRVDVLTFTTLTIYTFSSLCNPLIYCGRTAEIRGAVMSTLTSIKDFICRKYVDVQTSDK